MRKIFAEFSITAFNFCLYGQNKEAGNFRVWKFLRDYCIFSVTHTALNDINP